jgi:uncharacterized protein YndB with AHSA1/START domain
MQGDAMDSLLKPNETELVVTRDLNAPRERVFSAWTDVAKAAIWWAPQNCTLLSCEMDLRPGGAWQRRMRAPGGTIIIKYGVYREVVPAHRLVFTYTTDYADGTTDPETLVDVTFEDLGGNRTRLTLRHTAFQTDVSRLGHLGGWTSCLERFTTFVSTDYR